ncbi:hypothetical protein ID866_9801 [Astraeus odoratus]|nr:hypothetical protein ID866_9801 [Astraeus odoratus]
MCSLQGSSHSGLSEHDFFALFRTAITPYHRKSDCFQDAVSKVKTRCEESHMDEQERVRARHYAPPLECAAFSKGYTPSPSSQTQAECVEALSRSAQFWSSYSGYLREIPQLCFAFGRWSDIDVAKEIYRNITEEKVALIRFLADKEKGAVATQQAYARANQDLQGILETVRSTSNELRDWSRSMDTTLNRSIESLFVDMHSFMRDIQHRDRVDHAEIMTKLREVLADLGHELAIVSELTAALDIIKHESLRNIDVADHVHQQLDMVAGGLTMIHDSVQQLVGLVSDTSRSLELFVAETQATHVVQQEVHASMLRLVDTVELLTQTTRQEVASINQTTTALVERLQEGYSLKWIQPLLVPVLQFWAGKSEIGLAGCLLCCFHVRGTHFTTLYFVRHALT